MSEPAGAKADDAELKGPPSRWWQLAVLACVFAVAGIVAQFKPTAVAEAVGGSAGVILYLAVSFWPLRTRQWFWPYMAGVTIAHGLMVVLTHWPVHRAWGKADTLLGVVDFYALWGLGMLLDHLSVKAAARGEGRDPS
jgi:hypothetical protein